MPRKKVSDLDRYKELAVKAGIEIEMPTHAEVAAYHATAAIRHGLEAHQEGRRIRAAANPRPNR